MTKLPDPTSATTPDGSIEVSVEVPGTPEEVWTAIATGPGIESWFMPNEIDEREGGRVAFDMGFGMQETGSISAWEPTRRFALREEWEGTLFATEFLVEGRSGGSCVVRLVSSITGDGDFSDELDQMREGWLAAFRTLQLYLERFAGQPVATMYVAHETHQSVDEAWAELLSGLGTDASAVGDRLTTTGAGVPALAGAVDRAQQASGSRTLLLVLDQPGPGVGHVAVVPDGEHLNAVVHLHLYGDGAAAVAAEQEPAWRAWLAQRFPVPEVAQQTG